MKNRAGSARPLRSGSRCASSLPTTRRRRGRSRTCRRRRQSPAATTRRMFSSSPVQNKPEAQAKATFACASGLFLKPLNETEILLLFLHFPLDLDAAQHDIVPVAGVIERADAHAAPGK